MAEISLLLVEDKPSDVRLVMEAFKETSIHTNLSVVGNGEDAINFLLKKGQYSDAPRPDLILLDLKLPKKNGHEVIEKVRETPSVATIPIIVLSNSDSAADIQKAYKHQANCYITKPFKMSEFIEVVKLIEKFWFNHVKLPKAD
jgi:two-component system, chemotaxis family, response regulator Rcp1